MLFRLNLLKVFRQSKSKKWQVLVASIEPEEFDLLPADAIAGFKPKSGSLEMILQGSIRHQVGKTLSKLKESHVEIPAEAFEGLTQAHGEDSICFFAE